eukprot:464876-Amphidinium_carterae.1
MTIMLENVGKPSSMPKPSSSSTACGPSSMSALIAKLTPLLQVDWIKASLQTREVRTSSRNLLEQPRLT